MQEVIQEMWNKFLCRYTEVVEKCIPAKSTTLVNSKHNPKWMTVRVAEQITRKKRHGNSIVRKGPDAGASNTAGLGVKLPELSEKPSPSLSICWPRI